MQMLEHYYYPLVPNQQFCVYRLSLRLQTHTVNIIIISSRAARPWPTVIVCVTDAVSYTHLCSSHHHIHNMAEGRCCLFRRQRSSSHLLLGLCPVTVDFAVC